MFAHHRGLDIVLSQTGEEKHGRTLMIIGIFFFFYDVEVVSEFLYCFAHFEEKKKKEKQFFNQLREKGGGGATKER